MVAKRIAIIPARGGSKRIPQKNIIDFIGKPMIAWSISAAKETRLFDRVLVSTDDPSVAEIARQWGAEVPFLRDEYADDQSPVSDATIFALEQAENFWGEKYCTVVQLMPNCPLRDSTDISSAVTSFEIRQRSFQISCFKYGWMNPWWAVKLNNSGHPEHLFPDAMKKRSQDLPSLYCPTGAIWIAQSSKLVSQGSFYGEGHCFEPMDWTGAIDIDDYEDLQLAHATWKLKQGLREKSNVCFEII